MAGDDIASDDNDDDDAVFADGVRRRHVEHKAGARVQEHVGPRRPVVRLLLQPRQTGRGDPRAHDAVRRHQRRRLAVPDAARRRLALARTLPRMLVAWQRRRRRGQLQGGVRRRARQPADTVTRDRLINDVVSRAIIACSSCATRKI